MRTNEEMLNAVHGRASEMRRKRSRRRTIFMGGGAAACALALIALLAQAMPSLQDKLVPGNGGAAMQASILADSGALGFAVVGIVAFMLGVAVTVLCLLMRRQRDGEDERHDRKH